MKGGRVMQMPRTALGVTIILALLGGLGAAPVAVVAQPDELTATWVTGTSSTMARRGPESMTEYSVRGLGTTSTVDWSDPRLPATMTTITNSDEHLLESGNAATWAQAYRLDGPDGVWVGTGRAVSFPDGAVWLLFLTGEGAYEGLGAALRVSPTGDGEFTYEGYIYDTGLPPVPDPEPAAE
jgi:hypothetical protein